MNTSILSKAIEELKKDKPDLSYLRGMLETLMEMQTPAQIATEKLKEVISNTSVLMPFTPSTSLNEASVLDARARQAIETIKLTETVE